MADLTTVADVKAFLGIPSGTTTDDGLLARLVSAASALVEGWCGRPFAAAASTDTVSGSGGVEVLLRHTPVMSVASVTVDGAAIPERAAVGQRGWLLMDAEIGWLVLDGAGFTRGVGNVVVTYTAGYASTPPEVAQATIDLVARKYRLKATPHLVTQGGPNGESTTFDRSDLPAEAKRALQPYVRVIP